MTTTSTTPVFKQGDEVVLVAGTYPGTRGTFLNLRPDPKWADIKQLNGKICSHPVEWMDYWTGSYKGRSFRTASENS